MIPYYYLVRERRLRWGISEVFKFSIVANFSFRSTQWGWQRCHHLHNPVSLFSSQRAGESSQRRPWPPNAHEVSSYPNLVMRWCRTINNWSNSSYVVGTSVHQQRKVKTLPTPHWTKHCLPCLPEPGTSFVAINCCPKIVLVLRRRPPWRIV